MISALFALASLQVEEDLKFSIDIAPARIVLADQTPINLKIFVKNESTENVLLDLNSFWHRHRLRVVGEDGVDLPLSEDAKERAKYPISFGYGFRGANIGGGETFTYSTGNVRDILEWKPGIYRMSVVYSGKGGFEYETPSKVIEVVR